MSRGRHTFRQRDLTRALKSMRAAGVPIERIGFDEHGRPVISAAPGTSEAVGKANDAPQDAVEL